MGPSTKHRLIAAARWAGAAATVLALYALIGWLVLFRSPSTVDDGGGEPAVEIDLQPVPPTAVQPPSEAPPGPPEVQPQSQAQPASPPPVETNTDPDPPPPPQQAEAQLPAPEKPIPPPPPPPAPTLAAPPPTAPESVEAPQGPPTPADPGRTEEAPSRAVLTWQRLLVSRLERAKRYPPQAEGREGATTVSFTIDRAGQLTGSHVVRSSGSMIFDEATLALLQRCQPFPTPPRDLGDARRSFEVTIRYAR